jgi:hypothetical protein
MTFIRTMLIISALGAGSLAASACNRTPEEARKDGVEAQQEATAKIRDNEQEAQKAVTEAQQAAKYDNAQAQAKANEEIREANREVGADKTELRAWGQKKIDDLNDRIDSARVKAQNAAPKAQTKFDAAMKSVQAKRDQLASEVASIEEPGARTPADFKAHFDTEVSRLEKRIDTVEHSL